MSLTAKRLVPGVIVTTTAAKCYEASDESAIIEQPTFTNIGAASVTVQAWLLPGGATLTPEYMVQFVVDAGETYRAAELAGHVIEQGGALWLSTVSGSVNAIISGAGIV